MSDEPEAITCAEVRHWTAGNFSNYAERWLWEILTGKYDLATAREDVLSFREDRLIPAHFDEDSV